MSLKLLKKLGQCTFVSCLLAGNVVQAEIVISYTNGQIKTFSSFDEIVDKNDIVEITLEDDITRIPSCAFSACRKLVHVEIHSKLSSIGEYAFSGCDNLVKVIFPNGAAVLMENGAFNGCDQLNEFGNSKPGDWFFRCIRPVFSSIFSSDPIHISTPEGEMEILDRNNSSFFIYADGGENSLLEIELTYSDESKETCSSFCDLANKDEVVSVTIRGENVCIPNKAFKSWKNLKEVFLSEGVISIDDEAFWGCENLAHVKISPTVLSIGVQAFSRCYALNNIEIPDNSHLVIIKSNAFFYSNIKNLNLPEGLCILAPYAFCGCSKLTNIEIPSTVKFVGPYTFLACGQLTEIKISKNTKVANTAFNPGNKVKILTEDREENK